MSLGQIIKTRRMESSMTIPQLAESTGLSRGFISQVENDKVSLSLDSLKKIAQALHLPMNQLLGETGFEPEIIRKTERPKISCGSGPELELLSTPFGRRLQLMTVELPVGYQTGTLQADQEGEKCTWVLKGRLEIQQGDFSATLEEGDSIHMDCSRPHVCNNTSDQPTLIVIAMTPPSFSPCKKIEE